MSKELINKILEDIGLESITQYDQSVNDLEGGVPGEKIEDLLPAIKEQAVVIDNQNYKMHR